MKKILFFIFFSCFSCFSQEDILVKKTCEQLIKLNFSESEILIDKISEREIRIELKTLSKILYNYGQAKKNDSLSIHNLPDKQISKKGAIIRSITKAYYNLFYYRRTENTYSLINEAYQLSKKSNLEHFQKLSLLAFLNNYARENTLDEKSFSIFLEEYKKISSTIADEMWIVFYKNLFVGRSINGTEANFKKTARKNIRFLKKHEDSLSIGLKSHLYENIGVYYRVSNISDSAKFFLNNAIQLPNYPYLKENKFISYLDLAEIATSENKIPLAKEYFNLAKKNLNIGDTIKSLVSYKLFKAHYYHFPLKEYDSAYIYLNESFKFNRKINYEENILKMSELNVQLQSKEKEKKIVQLLNTNLKSEAQRIKNRNWLIGSSSALILGLLIAILLYKNTKRKQHIAEQEREIEIQKTEKLLKEQELTAIDAMISGQEKERQRLANDLHDNLGSTLATVKLHFDHLKNNRDNPKVENIDELYSKTNNLLDEAYQKVRTIAHEKNSGVMANQGLLPAVKNLAKKASNGDGLQIEVQEYGLNERLDNALEISIFRMIQELIANTIKHANASEIHISLTNHDSLLNIIVEDNGKGFNAKILPEKEGMGLKSIEKRIEHLEGTFEIDSTIGKGTNIIINIPI